MKRIKNYKKLPELREAIKKELKINETMVAKNVSEILRISTKFE